MIDPQQFARDWVAAWSRRDVDAVLAHYDDRAVFTSPKAQTIVGTARLADKAALESYWRAALERIPRITFELQRALWDDATRTLIVLYLADLAGNRSHGCEVMRFSERDLVIEGEAFYGAIVG